MWRYLAGAASALLLVAAGFFMAKGLAGKAAQATPETTATAEALSPAMNFAELPEPPRASELSKEQKRFNRYDRDRNQAVSKEEFLTSRRKAYERLDTNKDGLISFDEYSAKAQLKFAKADVNRSATLDRREFSTTRVVRKQKPRPDCPPPLRQPKTDSEDDSDA